MTLMKFDRLEPPARTGGRGIGDGVVNHCGSSRQGKVLGAAQTPLGLDGARYRICLECALPLENFDQAQAQKCRCLAYAEAEDDWLDLGGLELAVTLFLGIACVTLCCWLSL